MNFMKLKSKSSPKQKIKYKMAYIVAKKKYSKSKCPRCGFYVSGEGWGYFKCNNCGEELYWGSDF